MPHLAFLPWVVALILCAPVLFFVLYPLYSHYSHQLTRASAGTDRQNGTALSSQIESEQAARRALKEVELDYQLGNLAEPDYRSLRERYMRRAFSAHKTMQAHEQQLDELIEERLRRMRDEQEARGTQEIGEHEGPENAEE